MYRSFGIFGLSAALFVAAASCSRMQSFELSGRIDGLQVGDTLRFERVLLPEWNYEPAFDVVVGEAGAFAYRGEQAHDGYYSMTYHPKSGRAASRSSILSGHASPMRRNLRPHPQKTDIKPNVRTPSRKILLPGRRPPS